MTMEDHLCGVLLPVPGRRPDKYHVVSPSVVETAELEEEMTLPYFDKERAG